MPSAQRTHPADMQADHIRILGQELSVRKIPFSLAQVWYASMYWEPSTRYTRALFAYSLLAWKANKDKDTFLREFENSASLRAAYTEHYDRHGPYSLNHIPWAQGNDEEIVEV